MLNGQPVFALCTARVHNPEVRESVLAFVNAATARGYRVLVFNSSVDYAQPTKSDISCYSVYDLIPYHIVDLIVVMRETIRNRIVCNTIASIAKEHHTPIMCYDGKMERVPSVYSYSSAAFDSLLDHIIGDHHCTKVDFLTGIRGNYGSECMVLLYQESLRKYGIPFDEERIGYGDYWEQPAIAAVEKFLMKDTPEAIVCVNDEMAIAACSVLHRHGLRVPEDVIVTGNDGIVRERYHTPRLTTCVKDYSRLCAAAIDTAELIMDGEDVPLELEIPPLLQISESCGCRITEERDQNAAIRALYHQLALTINQEADEHWIQGNLLSRKQTTVIDYLDVLVDHIPEEAYICLRDNLTEDVTDTALTQFADNTELINTVCHKQKDRKFQMIPRMNLVPNLEALLDEGKTLFINSIYMLNDVYGYYVYYGDNPDEECFKLPKLIHTAGNVIGTSLTTSRLRSMNERLVATRVRDSLTGMLNLHGALKALSERISMCNHNKERIVMVAIGLKRLRQINSLYGRSEGDQALLSLANAIQDCIDSDVTAARIGGDEFLIAFFSRSMGINTADALITVLKNRLKSYNQVSGKNYALEIAVGRISAPTSTSLSLESMINEAVALKDNQKAEGMENNTHSSVSAEDAKVIEHILNDNLLSYHFQPIIHARTGHVYAYEALMRTPSDTKISPINVLQYASAADRLYDIEWLTYNNVLKYVSEHEDEFKGKRIFINSIPGHFLSEGDFNKLKEQYEDYLQLMVVEFTEQAETEGEELEQIRRRCIANRMDIAVDDYGTGYSNVANLLRYSPNYVKIDRSLISNIQEEPKKQHFVTNIIEFAHANGFMALAEGVETMEELRAVIRFGIDLIQGNFTAKPLPQPVDNIPQGIIALISRFNASANRQLVQKTFIPDGEPYIQLMKLEDEKYTDIFVSQPELDIIGEFGEESKIRIKLKDDLTCKLVLQNVHFNSTQQAPVILLGRNSNVTIEFQGDNRFDAGGIMVPESSTVYITGHGNLSIRADDTKSFVIGNDADFACGDINIDLAGCLNIISNGNQCIGIGSGIGKGQKITICGTKLFLQMSGKAGVGVGSLDGSAEIEMIGCSASFGDMRSAAAVAIGSHTGRPQIRCNTASISVLGSGTSICCVGSFEGGADIIMRDSSLEAKIVGQNLILAGSNDSAPNISIRECDIKLRAEGTNALDFGSRSKDADVTLLDTALDIDLRSANALHLAADPSHCIVSGGTKKVMINE